MVERQGAPGSVASKVKWLTVTWFQGLRVPRRVGRVGARPGSAGVIALSGFRSRDDRNRSENFSYVNAVFAFVRVTVVLPSPPLLHDPREVPMSHAGLVAARTEAFASQRPIAWQMEKERKL